MPLSRRKRPRKLPGDSAILIMAGIRKLVAQGRWDVRDSEIHKAVGVSKTTYYRLLETDRLVKATLWHYQQARLGRGPLSSSEGGWVGKYDTPTPRHNGRHMERRHDGTS